MTDTPRSSPDQPRLVVEHLTVTFGSTVAVDDVSFALEPGEIVGLLGHNGAGKSTIMNVLSGVVGATSGAVTLDGAVIGGLTPADAAARGITIVHQEPALVPTLSVFDNMFLGRSTAGDRRERRARARAALDRLGARIDLDAPVAALGLGGRQLVDIARGIVGGDMKVLLLDEPTAALGTADAVRLHELIRELATQGVTIVYVSHRMPDIFDVCRRMIVLRNGRLVFDERAEVADSGSVTHALAPGLETWQRAETPPPGDVRLTIDDEPELQVRAGEVVGLFGMAGAEQFTLASRLFGGGEPLAVVVDGRSVTVKSPAQAIRHGLASVPADRESDGLVGNQTAVETVMFPWLADEASRGWWVTGSAGHDVYERARADLSIHGPGATAPIGSFSGGNRQKHLIARWTHVRTPAVLIVAQPTQGVDIAARVDIARVIRAVAADGGAVIVASAEADELAMMCDRAVVMYGAKRAHVASGPDFDTHLLTNLLELAAETSDDSSHHEAASS